MKRFFNTNLFWSAFTKDKGNCSGFEAEALVDLVYPLLLKRSADPQGLVDYSLRLQRGELTALGLMQELMGSEEYQQAQGEYDYLQIPVEMEDAVVKEVLTLIGALPKVVDKVSDSNSQI